MDRTDLTPTGCIDLAQHRLGKTTDMIHAELRALHAYWDALRGERAAPFRSEVDPRDMRCDPRNLFILEDLGRGNVRFRLSGTALIEAFGVDLRGMSARAILEGKARDSFGAMLAETLAEPAIGYARLRRLSAPGDLWEVLLLPLRSESGKLDRLIGCLHPVSGIRTAAGREPLRFAIEEMAIRPVTAGVPGASALPRSVPTAVPGLPRAAGFAEAAPRFAGKPAEGPRLVAIDGGKASATAPKAKPKLRLVTDE